MQIAPVDSIYSAYDPCEVSEVSFDTTTINNTSSEDSALATNKVSGLELPATAVAINPISQESIEFQELQSNIVSSFSDLKEGRISNDEFSNSLQELGMQTTKLFDENQNLSSNEQDITNLTSSLIESLKGNNQGSAEIELSSYASIMDIVNKETQTPKVNEQLQAYTQNLRN